MGATAQRVGLPFRPTERQWELARAWNGQAKHILASGAVRSGKTQAAARLIVEAAIEHPCLYVIARMTYGELRDSTQQAILEGDGSLPPLLPYEARDHSRGTRGYVGGDVKTVYLSNGAEIRFRNLEHAHVWLNTAYGAVMIDQAEEMDGGLEGERLVDTINTRLSDPRGPRKIIFVANPGPTTHWLYRRFVNRKTRWPNHAWIHFTLRDNAANLPDDLIADLEGVRERRPHFYRAMVLGEWGVFEGAAYEEFSHDIHVVSLDEIPNEWARRESMDFGVANPTAWLIAAVDYDGNTIVFDELYGVGHIEDHAKTILGLRERGRDGRNPWWQRDGGGLVPATCYADPAIKTRWGTRDPRGRERSAESEYLEHGIGFAYGQNDRKAGYARIRELLHPSEDRPFPDWHPKYGQLGSPRLFVVRRCENAIQQLQDAPVKAEGKDSLDVVDSDWEHNFGHAHAALRYLTMASSYPSDRPVETPERLKQLENDPRLREIDRWDKAIRGEEGDLAEIEQWDDEVFYEYEYI